MADQGCPWPRDGQPRPALAPGWPVFWVFFCIGPRCPERHGGTRGLHEGFSSVCGGMFSTLFPLGGTIEVSCVGRREMYFPIVRFPGGSLGNWGGEGDVSLHMGKHPRCVLSPWGGMGPHALCCLMGRAKILCSETPKADTGFGFPGEWTRVNCDSR